MLSAILNITCLAGFVAIIWWFERDSRKNRRERRAADKQAVRIAKHLREAKKAQDVLFYNTLILGLPAAWEDVKKILDEIEEDDRSRREVAKMFADHHANTVLTEELPPEENNGRTANT